MSQKTYTEKRIYRAFADEQAANAAHYLIAEHTPGAVFTGIAYHAPSDIRSIYRCSFPAYVGGQIVEVFRVNPLPKRNQGPRYVA